MLITGDTITIAGDAGETLSISRQPLTHVERQLTAALRPVKFREILNTGSFGIPDWAQRVEYDKLKEYAEWTPIEFSVHGEETPSAEVSISSESFKLFAMGSGYAYTNGELRRAAQLGVALDMARANAVAKKAQSVLDSIAAFGSSRTASPDGTAGSTPSNTTGVRGLYNVNGASVATVSGTTTSWGDAYEADPDAGIAAIVNDCLLVEAAIESATKETSPPDTLVMPLSLATVMRGRNKYTDKSLEEILRTSCRFLKRFLYWSKGDAAGVGGLRRLVFFNARDEDVARMVIAREPLPEAPFQMPYKVYTPMSLSTAGVVCKMPEAVAYVDMAADSE